MSNPTAGENELVRRARAGDTQAFGALVLAHQTFAYNLALRAVGDPIDAQDLTQEAFLRAWQALPGFRGQAGFRTWLYRIVVNLCYNRAPQLKRELAQVGVDNDETFAVANRPPDPERSLEAAELRRVLWAEVERLPKSYRLLVLLRYQQGLSYEEIAGILEMPLGTVKTGLHRAHARLKTALKTSLEGAFFPKEEPVYE